jgi:hypothetical protein
MGVFYWFRKGKIATLKSDCYPDVPPETFQKWRNLEIQSIHYFLWATWGTNLIGFVLIPMSGEGALPLLGVLAVVWLVLLFLSANAGSQAASMRKEHGLKLPS